MAHDIVLDAAVRDWVFIPLTAAIVLMKLLTQYMHQVRVHEGVARRQAGSGPAARRKSARARAALAGSLRCCLTLPSCRIKPTTRPRAVPATRSLA